MSKKTATQVSSDKLVAGQRVSEGFEQLLFPMIDLVPDPRNARFHSKRNIEEIGKALKKSGVHRAVVARKDDRRIIVGNGMVFAAQQLGWTHMPVTWVNDDETEATVRGLADNKLAELAEWDTAALATLLRELHTSDEALEGTGFTPDELRQALADDGDDMGVQDEVPAPPDHPVTRKGDVWLLGEHRLICGDSSSVEDLDNLLAGDVVHLLNTDPPYNVKVEPRSNNAIAAGNSSFTKTHHQSLDLARHPEKNKGTTKKMRAKDRPLANDFVSDEHFEKILREWFKNAARVMAPGASFYIWGGYANVANYPPAMLEANFYFSQSIIWVKEHPVLTRKDFMGNHEWCFYGWKHDAAHRWLGPTNATDTWIVKKVNPQSMVHLTEKPVELAVRAINYSSLPGEVVLDLFGGSGSTMAACEQTQRRGRLVEMDEAYCDVICTRMKNAGLAVTLRSTGQTFAEVAQEREVALATA